MKPIWYMEGLLAVLMMFCLQGCVIPGWPHNLPIPPIDFDGINDVIQIPVVPDVPVVTNAPDVSPDVGQVATGHVIAAIGPEELISTVSGDRPSVAIGAGTLPVTVWDKGTGNTLWIYRRLNNGTWQGGVFVQRSKTYDAGRIFIPHVECDEQGRAWVSAKFGIKTGGKMGGQGLWTGNGTFVLSRTKGDRGDGNVVMLPGPIGVLLCSDGRWEGYYETGILASSGQIKLGNSGEKIRGQVSGNIMHVAMNGFTGQDGMYGNNAMNKPVSWSSSVTYPEQGNDLCHPSVGIDKKNPNICYIASQYAKGIFLNIWNGSKMLYSPTNLCLVSAGGYTGSDRFGPQLSPCLGGGAFIAWCKGHRIKVRWIGSDGSMGPVVDICDGRVPAMATDGQGQIWLVYDNGGMKCRKTTIK